MLVSHVRDVAQASSSKEVDDPELANHFDELDIGLERVCQTLGTLTEMLSVSSKHTVHNDGDLIDCLVSLDGQIRMRRGHKNLSKAMYLVAHNDTIIEEHTSVDLFRPGKRFALKTGVKLTFEQTTHHDSVPVLQGLDATIEEMFVAVEHLATLGPIKERGGPWLTGGGVTVLPSVLLAWSKRLDWDVDVARFKGNDWAAFHAGAALYIEQAAQPRTPTSAATSASVQGPVDAKGKGKGPPLLVKGGGKCEGDGKGKGKGPPPPVKGGGKCEGDGTGKGKGPPLSAKGGGKCEGDGKGKGKGPPLSAKGGPLGKGKHAGDSVGDSAEAAAGAAEMAAKNRMQKSLLGVQDRQLVKLERSYDTWVDVCSSRHADERVDIEQAFGGHGKLLLLACIPHEKKAKPKKKKSHSSLLKVISPTNNNLRSNHESMVRRLCPVDEEFRGRGLSVPPKETPWRETIEVARAFASLDWHKLCDLEGRKLIQVDVVVPRMDIFLHMKHPDVDETTEKPH